MKPWAWLTTVLLVWLCVGGPLEAIAQPWHTAEAIPVFRGTPSQDNAWRKLNESATCLHQLSSLWSAARIYALDHADRLPQEWTDFTNAIAQPGDLHCPADASHPLPTSWAEVDLAAVSYEIVAPGVTLGATNQTYLRCKIHGNTVTTHGLRSALRPYDGRGFPVARLDGLALPVPALLAAKEGAVSVGCLQNLRVLGTAAHLFATDHNGYLPSSFPEIVDALDTPDVFVCPSDLLRPAAASLVGLMPSNITYAIDAPGIRADVVPVQRFVTCPIHGHHLDTDGSVAQATNRYPPRLIVGHPLSWTVEPGRPLELAVLTGDPGLGPFRYQWRRLEPFDAAGDPFTNTVVLAGATNRTWRIAGAATADEGYYDVIVSDADGGYQISHLAYVRVEPLTNLNAAFSWEPIACFNNLKQIDLAARLSATLNQDQLPRSLSDLPAFLGWPLSLYCPSDTNRTAPADWATMDFSDSSYTLETDVPSDPGTNVLATCKVHRYYVQSDGSVRLGEVAPVISMHPASQVTFAGRPVSLTIEAIGDFKDCQWFRNGEPLTRETNWTLALPGGSVTNTAGYRAIVTNAWGSATSHVATVTVNSIPPPTLNWAMTGNGLELVLSLAAPAGVECVIEASPDLASWAALGTNVLGPDGLFAFIQRRDVLSAPRFYRTRLR